MSVNEFQVLSTAIGRRLRSARLNRDSRQLGVRVADDKELLAADVVFVATPLATLDGSRNIENLGLIVAQLAYGSGFGNRVTLRAYAS